MTKNQVEMLVSRWLAEALDEAEDDRAIGGLITESAREAVQYGLSAAFDGANEALLTGDIPESCREEADQLLQAAGLPALDHSGADFRRLCRRLLRAKIDFLRIESGRWDGEYQSSTYAEVQAAPSLADHKTVIAPLLFTVVLEKYFQANPRPPKTEGQAKAEFKRFVKILGGDKPIGEVSKADAVRYKEDLQLQRKLRPATCMRHLLAVAALFRWAEVHGFVSSNPALGLAPKKKEARKQAQRRRPFTDEELVKVFSSEEFRRQRVERPERYWVVLLLLFECCRREEAGQLYLKDLTEVDGVPCISITDEEKDQTLKNEGSKRKVPIHSSLLRLGFMEYVKTIHQGGHVRLFPQLDRKGANGYADPVGKYFSRLVTSLGITDPRVVIHSLRHGGITKLHSAGVSGNLVETLVGHSAGNVHEQYVHRELMSMKTLRDALERLQYPEVMRVLQASPG